MASRSHTVACLGSHGFHTMAYRQWGKPGRDLVCVHGLTRNSHDFDRFAAVLQQDYRVTCPDVVGRGRSDWLVDKASYGYPQYTADMAALIARLGVRELDWVGTSMGGIIGMMLAAQPNTPLRKLVLNDIGPAVPRALVLRILDYLGQEPAFATLEQAKRYLQELYAGFGPLSEAQWLEVAVNSTYQKRDGSYGLAYDPGIADPWRAVPREEHQDIDLWGVWDKVRCPVLVLRGAVSDAITWQTAERMQTRGPAEVTVIEVPETGHAPPLMDPEQIERVRRWLLE